MLPASVQVWLATEPVDMRRGHDGLLALVRALGVADPYSGHLFVFLGRRADRCKILYWDRGGFFVTYKRLERGRFRLPAIARDTATVAMDGTALAMLLDGIDLKRVRRPELWSPKKCAPDVDRGSTRASRFDPTSMWQPSASATPRRS
jgi:transposase